MLLGHIAFGQDDVVSLNAPNGYFRLRKIEPPPYTPLIGDHHRVHCSFIQRPPNAPVK